MGQTGDNTPMAQANGNLYQGSSAIKEITALLSVIVGRYFSMGFDNDLLGCSHFRIFYGCQGSWKLAAIRLA